MAATRGVTTIDFGATGDDMVTTTVTGQAFVAADTDLEGYFLGEATADNDADAHALARALVAITLGNRVPGVGFDIIAVCEDACVTGTFNIRWVGV
ncbi:MAG: hypothetical protein ACJ8AD_14860 [Gemmatimonadaceae bacterium]